MAANGLQGIHSSPSFVIINGLRFADGESQMIMSGN